MVEQSLHSNLTLESVLSRLMETASRPFEDARPMPPEVSHSKEFLKYEFEKIFTKEWICIGRADEIPEKGDYLCHEISGVPVTAIRQEDGSVKSFVNACAHRFTRLLNDNTGSINKITCPYHAWTYDCAGNLIRAPFMEMKGGFDKSGHSLRALQSDIWEGFLYISLANNPTPSLSERLAPLSNNIVGRYEMSCYQTVIRESMIWNANWKNLIENFTESYHVPMVHGQTFALHEKKLETYVCGEDSDYYGYHHAVQESEKGQGAAHPANKRLEGEWRRRMVDFCIFPCHLVTLMPDYLWYISVQPVTTDKMKATWGVALCPDTLADVSTADYDKWLGEFHNYMDIANSEDKPLVEALHKGTASFILPQGILHPIERNLWQFTRYLARMCAPS